MKPWEKLLVDIWNWLTQGWRKYITVPIFIFCFIIPLISNDSYMKIFGYIHKKIQSSESFPTKDERDAFNEWVIVLSAYNNFEQAEIDKNKFQDVYIKSGHKIWTNDIFIVRNPVHNQEWLLIIDTNPETKTESDVKFSMNDLLENQSRDIRNEFAHWLYGAFPMYYDKSKFIKTYGKIVKPEIERNSR